MPAGLLTHVAGVSGDDALVVVETWESKEAQEKLLADQLGPALGEVGAPHPSRMQWFTLEGEKPEPNAGTMSAARSATPITPAARPAPTALKFASRQGSGICRVGPL